MTDQPPGLLAIADRYRVSLDAVRHLIQALEAGHGRMAQFNHPDLGGFGQWSGAGMTMIGDMFNAELKARVDALCTTLAAALPASPSASSPVSPPAGPAAARGAGSPWPAEWGAPATSGSQNGMRYGYFPAQRRLVVEADGRVATYDTGEHAISGVSQQQGGGATLRFSGPGGPVDLASLRRLDPAEREVRSFAPEPFEGGTPAAEAPASTAPAAPIVGGDLLSTIERLSEMRRKGILTEGEFTAKKAELLARL